MMAVLRSTVRSNLLIHVKVWHSGERSTDHAAYEPGPQVLHLFDDGNTLLKWLASVRRLNIYICIATYYI